MSVSLSVDGFGAPWVVENAELQFKKLEEKHNYDQGDEIMDGWNKKEEVVAKYHDVFPWFTNMGWGTYMACLDILGMNPANTDDSCGILSYEGCPEKVEDIDPNLVDLMVVKDGRMSMEDGRRYYRGKCRDIVMLVQLARLTGRDISYG